MVPKMEKGDELKLSSADLRTYLDQARNSDSVGILATALVAEGSLDNQGVSKPTDLYFTAGRQKFLKMAQDILERASREDLLTGLEGKNAVHLLLSAYRGGHGT